MAKGLSYYARRLRWLLHYYRGEHDVTIETANGLLSCRNKDWLIGKHLFTLRNYEFDFIKMSLAFLRSEGLLRPGMNHTVADIGSNLGMICIALLRENAFEKAVAFEPSPESFRLLQKNVGQNGLAGRIDCFPLALSSADGELSFELAEDNSGDSRVRQTSMEGTMDEHRRPTVSVAAKRFDSFLAEASVDPDQIDLLWIDVQGHEGHFFKGAERFFANRKVPVISEFWGYGIGRSGMSREEYCETVERTFSKFYVLNEGRYESRPISDVKGLFETHSRPREIANLVFV